LSMLICERNTTMSENGKFILDYFHLACW
jgi:hypothetical protein